MPEIVRIQNGLTNVPSVVLEEWRNTFENLYYPTLNHYDKDFYETAMTYIDQYETNAPVENNAIINGNITFGETVKIITKLKSKKAVGVDYIPNEIIKQPGLHYALFKLFVSIFDKGIVPSIWLKAIINPIPKGSSKDPYVPLNYRGISLLSCISKTYTSLINEQINKFCEQNDLLVDEQNGRQHFAHLLIWKRLLTFLIAIYYYTDYCFIKLTGNYSNPSELYMDTHQLA